MQDFIKKYHRDNPNIYIKRSDLETKFQSQLSKQDLQRILNKMEEDGNIYEAEVGTYGCVFD